MALLRFRVYWEDDDLIYRDLEVLPGQSFQEFHQAIAVSFDFDGKKSAFFFESGDRWERGRAISSEVLVNKKDAPALSMQKTPVSALVTKPGQKFVYEYDPVRKWTFLVELIGVSRDAEDGVGYPRCVRKEGVSPGQQAAHSGGIEKLLEMEDQYDLGADEMAEGFSNEGENSGDGDSF